MPLAPNTRYNTNLFAIAPKRDKLILQQGSNTISLPQQNVKVYNIGRTKVFVELLYGIENQWQGLVDSYTVEPGKTKILDNKGKKYHTTGLKVSNLTDVRAVIQASTADGNFPMVVAKEPGLYDYEYHKKLKKLFSVGVKYTPYLTKRFRGLLYAFWPKSKANVWVQIEVKLQPFLEDHVLDQIRGFVDSFVENMGDRIRSLSAEIEEGRQVEKYYMQIAHDLKGFEKKLMYRGNLHYYKAINKFLLPLYSNFILMKITFYTLGITCSEGLGLSKSNINFVQDKLNDTINGNSGASKLISDLLKEWAHMVYDNCHPEDIYNTMMNTRSLIGLHGTEYSAIWDNMMISPTTGEKIYNDVISYSTFFGSPTANLYREAIREQMDPPLTPILVGFKRNCIRSVDIFLYCKSSTAPKIGGAKIVFENDDTYIMGTETKQIEKIDFNRERILKIVVTGDGAVDSCTFYMSDKRKLSFGTRESETSEETFELKDHHIVSFFMSNDNVALRGQAANIAVAYRLNDDYECL